MFFQAGLIVLSLAAIAQGDPRIRGGNDAPNHKYPYQVSLRYDSRGHFCGGSILNNRWILTAAHCFEHKVMNKIWISAGTNYLNENGTVYEPENIVIPKEYRTFAHNDIALIRLKNDIVFTDFVNSIGLPTEDLQDYSRTAIFSGWGRTSTYGKVPNALQEIHLNLLASEKCKKVLTQIDKRHICTLNKRGEGVCPGDSGGPLVIDGEQIGIASYGRLPCGDWPEAWTRVFSYKDWILKSMQHFDGVRG